jgi:hypothetical protein
VTDLDPVSMLTRAFSYDYFHAGPGELQPPIPYVWREGHKDQRLTVIVGENACGKSFLRRILHALHHKAKCELLHLSMEGRKGYMASLVYGDESMSSTGHNSVRLVLGAMRNADERKSDTAIFWDEPDLGLSDSWAAGVGQRIAKYSLTAPPHVRGIYLVTHRKCLLRELVIVKPHFVLLGDEVEELDPRRCPTFRSWIDRPVVPRSDLESLSEISQARFKQILNVVRPEKPK